MLFTTPQFFLFLAVVLVLFYTLPRATRKPMLLLASYFFYASWNWKFIPLLLGLTIVDYLAALWMAKVDARWRKPVLVVSLVANLGFLAFFKYYNFLADNLAQALGKTGHPFALSIVLPLGISFHTFQSMSYVVDVYRNEQEPVRNFLDYALFVAFFPQLVAGPIVRAKEFFVDLFHWRRPTHEEWLSGVALIALGAAKKMVLADQMSRVADAYFGHLPDHPGLVAAWSGVFAFAMQIFFDFSGYTDMAIGMARLFGFHFPVNFRRPYLAESVTEFWRRWHMSLSRWLRDYLYIPLGGNRGGTLATYRNLMLTMLLGGLWHGASWNFVIWGGYHGALLSTERALGVEPGKRGLFYPVRMLVTFVLVSIGWVFFRAANLHDSLWVIRELFLGARVGRLMQPAWLTALIVVALVIAFCEEAYGWFDRIASAPAWSYVVTIVLLLFGIELLSVADANIPFVYFQF
mgnify:CR=1 FL=1